MPKTCEDIKEEIKMEKRYYNKEYKIIVTETDLRMKYVLGIIEDMFTGNPSCSYRLFLEIEMESLEEVLE
jgi:hypothetical protein